MKIVKQSGDFYIVRFGTSGGIQVRSSRLFEMAEAAESSIMKNNEPRKVIFHTATCIDYDEKE